MAEWTGLEEINVAPLKRPCAACGVAERYLSRIGLCTACEQEYDAEMEEIDARERADDDAAARHLYYGQ